MYKPEKNHLNKQNKHRDSICVCLSHEINIGKYNQIKELLRRISVGWGASVLS